MVPFVAQTSDWAQESGAIDGVESDFDGVDSDIITEDVGLLDVGGEEEEDSYEEPSEEAKIFVGNLPYDCDSEQLANLFGQAGVVEVAEVLIFLLSFQLMFECGLFFFNPMFMFLCMKVSKFYVRGVAYFLILFI